MECAAIFHERTQRVMRDLIHVDKGKTRGVFGRVVDYVIRYEVQSRG